MVSGLIIAAWGAALGLLFGRAEARETKWRIDSLEGANLPHPWLLAARAMLIAPACTLLLGVGDWRAPATAFIVGMACCAMVHRIAYNRRCRRIGVSLTREWWYMGGCRRRLKDSWYDTLWWMLSARSVRLIHSDDGELCLMIRPISYAMPWALATLFELSVAFVAAWALHWRQI